MLDQQEIRAEEIRVVFRTPLALLASLVNGAFCVGVLWPKVPHLLLLGWAGLLALCLIARLSLWQAYRRRTSGMSEADRWGRWFTLGALVTGAVWGSLAAVI